MARVRKKRKIGEAAIKAGSDVKVPIGLGKRKRETKQKRRPKAARDADVESIDSDGSDCSGDATQDLGQAGIFRPSPNKEPLFSRDAEAFLFKKYENVKVLCDKPMGKCPSRAYFVKKQDGVLGGCKIRPVDRKNYFKLEYHVVDSNSDLPEGFLNHCVKRADLSVKGNEYVKVMDKLFEGLGRVLCYESGGWTENEIERHRHAAEIHTQYELSEIARLYRAGEMANAFCKGMTNSIGKQVLSSLINMALLISYGKDAFIQNNINCRPVRSSPDKTERVPLGDIPSSLCHPGMDSLTHRTLRYFDSAPVNTTDWVRTQNKAVPSVSKASGDGSVAGSGSTNKSFTGLCLDDCDVYADVMATSYIKPNWPHFLVIGEVKSKGEMPIGQIDFSEVAKAHLVREMLGAMLHQSFVHGILLSNTSALLVSMNMKFPERAIKVSFQQYYFFEIPLLRTGAPHFNHAHLSQLCLDLVGALNHTKENIKAVRHWPLKKMCPS